MQPFGGGRHPVGGCGVQLDLDGRYGDASFSVPEPGLADLVARLDRMLYPKAHPPGSEAGVVDGVDLALTDGEVGALIHGHVSGEPWDVNDTRSLIAAEAGLRRAIPYLEGEAKVFFDVELQIVRQLARVYGVPVSD